MSQVLRFAAITTCLSLAAGTAQAQQVTQSTLEGPSADPTFSLQVQGSDNILYFCRPETSVVAGQVTRFCRPASSFATPPAGGGLGLGAGVTGNVGLLGILAATVAIAAASDTN